MKHLLLALLLAAFATVATSAEPRTCELHKFQASPDKLDALHARIRDHQIPLLEKHGIRTAGVFTPAGENPDRLIYVLVSGDDLIKRWADFVEDPEWQKVMAEEKVVAEATKQGLRTTYWSPEFKPEKAAEPRVFELRTYTCPDRSKHSALMKRFREHTMALFAKHGMTNLIYWTPEDESDRRLIYLLAHKSEAAAKESFAAFRADPNWLAAKKASEEAAGGSLTEKENGVVSEFLEATDYSPLQ